MKPISGPGVFPIFALALGVAGCATPVPTAVADSEPAAPESVPDDLPRIALEPQVLYDVLLGEIALRRGQPEVAAQVLWRAAQATRDPRLAERAAAAAFQARRFDDAYQAAELWVELRPMNAQAREALATVMLELGRMDEARRQLGELLALEDARGRLDEGYLQVATVLGRHSNRAQALVVMEALADLRPQSSTARLYAAHLAVRAGDLGSAARFADSALVLQPQDEDTAIFRARVFLSSKDTEGAQAFFESYLKRFPRAFAVRTSYARFLSDQKQWDKAYVQYRQVLAQTPDDAEVAYAAGLLALQTDRRKEGEHHLKRSLDLRSDNDSARLVLGQVAEEDKRYDDAARWYGDVQAEEHRFDAQLRLALMQARRGQVDEGLGQIATLPVHSDRQIVQRALAHEELLRMAKRDNEALDMLTRALVAVPKDDDLRYARALVAERLDKLDLAEADLRDILKRDPKNANALNALGYTLADRTTRYDEAHELLQQAIALKPDDPYVLDSLGWVYYRLGRYAESIQLLRRALALKDEAEIAAHLGEVLWVSGERSEAESVWDRALRVTPDHTVLLDVIRKFKH